MGGRDGVGGVVSHLRCAVTPTLTPSAVSTSSMPNVTRSASKIRKDDKTTSEGATVNSSKRNSLEDRESSKLTLDDELFDILYAFRYTVFKIFGE
ncbi:hypothetical protein DICVIV_13950 [Dictyocaulus viviparus]|uniref:Uncharacterized protein n=1 Tax=Dictyocaulus viviparus TaxID=29172 RepID=A0A0D8X8M2_DICVI|nr:hypothetical protein DICVIV_13950 [Dictyocaulus viviparus]